VADAHDRNGSGKRAGPAQVEAQDTLNAAIGMLTGGLAKFIGFLFAAMLLLVTAQIVFRFVLEISVPWTEDVSRLLFVYVVYLGASVAFQERAMIVIDTVPSIWPGSAGALALVASMLTFLITAFLFYASIPMVMSSWNTSLPTVSWMSNGWAYLAFTISFGLMLLHSGAHVVLWLLGRRAAV
jgi:TRAP-type C4-dicarboxylate transport system permease small subunit